MEGLILALILVTILFLCVVLYAYADSKVSGVTKRKLRSNGTFDTPDFDYDDYTDYADYTSSSSSSYGGGDD